MGEVSRHENAMQLRDAAVEENLGEWTKALTAVAVSTCEGLGWYASAIGHRLELLPVARHEYLALDVMAFSESEGRWRFPVAVMELENSKDDDRVAYSLWKVLCVRTDFRLVFCYRSDPEAGRGLVRFLQEQVVKPMGIATRYGLTGETALVVGSREESAMFPYGFFTWWKLDKNTGTFSLI